MQEIFITALVTGVNTATFTCDVLTSRSKELRDVPILGVTGGVHSGSVTWLNDLRNSTVLIVHVDGRPYLLCTLPVKVNPLSEERDAPVSATVTGGANERTYGRTNNGYAGKRHTGFLPDDKVLVADGGAMLGLLSGGLAILKASPLAQIVLGKARDFIHIVARELRIMTDFGEMKFHHGSSGRTGMSIIGGALSGDEANAASGKPTVTVHLGDVPDAPDKRVVIMAESVDEEDYALIAYGIDGDMEQATSRDHRTSVGRNRDARVEGGDYAEIDGEQKLSVGGNQEAEIVGDRSVTVAGKVTETYGGNHQSSTGGNATHSSDGSYNINASGPVNICGSSINFSATNGSASGAPCTMTVASLNIVKA